MAKSEKKPKAIFTFMEHNLGGNLNRAEQELDKYLGDCKAILSGSKTTSYDSIDIVYTIGDLWYARTYVESYSSYDRLKRAIVEFLFSREGNHNTSIPSLVKTLREKDPETTKIGVRRVWVFKCKESCSIIKQNDVTGQLLITDKHSDKKITVDEAFSIIDASYQGEFRHVGKYPFVVIS